jgi:hypothetical protein
MKQITMTRDDGATTVVFDEPRSVEYAKARGFKRPTTSKAKPSGSQSTSNTNTTGAGDGDKE